MDLPRTLIGIADEERPLRRGKARLGKAEKIGASARIGDRQDQHLGPIDHIAQQQPALHKRPDHGICARAIGKGDPWIDARGDGRSGRNRTGHHHNAG